MIRIDFLGAGPAADHPMKTPQNRGDGAAFRELVDGERPAPQGDSPEAGSPPMEGGSEIGTCKAEAAPADAEVEEAGTDAAEADGPSPDADTPSFEERVAAAIDAVSAWEVAPTDGAAAAKVEEKAILAPAAEEWAGSAATGPGTPGLPVPGGAGAIPVSGGLLLAPASAMTAAGDTDVPHPARGEGTMAPVPAAGAQPGAPATVSTQAGLPGGVPAASDAGPASAAAAGLNGQATATSSLAPSGAPLPPPATPRTAEAGVATTGLGAATEVAAGQAERPLPARRAAYGKEGEGARIAPTPPQAASATQPAGQVTPMIGASQSPALLPRGETTKAKDTSGEKAAAQGFELGSAATITSAQQARATPMLFAPPEPARVTQQIADAVRRSSDGSIELALSPKELGSVRMSIHATETGTAIVMNVERDETMHLIRRHAELLHEAFRELGLGTLDLSFGGRDGREATPAAPPSSAQGNTAGETAEPAAAPPPLNLSGGLDLRM